MTMLVFGSRGYLGTNFVQHFQGLASVADIADRAQVAAELERHRPDVIINCAGKTGRPNVDWCEQHRRETLRCNLTGALVLADECLKRDCLLVHLSSGCLYSGDNGGKGFGDDDPPNFLGSYYVRTKRGRSRRCASFPY